MRTTIILCALALSGCYTSHTTYRHGAFTRTVAFGPAASIKVDGAKVDATTRDSPGMGSFVGSALGSFLRTVF